MTRKLVAVCSVRNCKAVVSAVGYCNHHYQMMHRWGNTDGNKLKCAICSKEFLRKAGRQVTCSKQCSSEYRKQFMKEFRSKQPTVRKQVKCAECGKSFFAKTYQKTCSDLCRAASRRHYEDERAKRRRKPMVLKCVVGVTNDSNLRPMPKPVARGVVRSMPKLDGLLQVKH